MLDLHFAPSIDLLVPIILEQMQAQWDDPLCSPRIIVPNPAIGKWLTMRLADGNISSTDSLQIRRGMGCVANLEMVRLEHYLWNILAPADTMCLLDVEHLMQVVCGILDEKLLASELYLTLRDYVYTNDEKIDSLKRVQLSGRIAHLFLEYEYNRPSVWQSDGSGTWRSHGIDATWLAGKNYFKNADNEAWQKDLYCRCSTLLGNNNQSPYISLPHLYRLRRENTLNPWVVPPCTLFLFGVSKVSHFHRNILAEISQMPGVNMRLFLTNPCAEFWEDVNTSRTAKIRRSWNSSSILSETGIPCRSQEDYSKNEFREFVSLKKHNPVLLQPDQELLELWGSAGKENIFLWCPQATWNFEYHSPSWIESESPPTTLLKAIQWSLLKRSTILPACEKPWHDDGSIKIVACPDKNREIQELKEQILDLVHAGTIDKLNEVVVYVPDPRAYVACIQKVFGSSDSSDPLSIPFSIVGDGGKQSLFAQGILCFTNIIEGSRFDRARIFEFLRNPLVQARRKSSAEMVAIWEKWAEDLCIFRGFNKEHRSLMGDKGLSATNAHTFELGIMRLLVGNVAASGLSLGGRSHLELGANEQADDFECIPYRDFETSDSDSVELFCALIDELYSDVLAFRHHDLSSVSENIDFLKTLFSKWFGSSFDVSSTHSNAEGRALQAFLDSLESIKLQETLAHRKSIDRKELLVLVKNCVPNESASINAAWVGGISFVPLHAAMIVPHKVVFVVGLGASVFPGTNEKPAWDLLSNHRIVGDSDIVRDNRFAFLELLLAAGDKLVLSYQARNMQKEECLQPASVLLELESYLINQGIVEKPDSGKSKCLIHQEIPWIKHESLELISRFGRKHGSWNWEDIERALLEHNPRVAHRHDINLASRLFGASSEVAVPRVRTSLASVRKFFANPLEYHLAKTLKLEFDEAPGSLSATDEPLDSGVLLLASLQKKIITQLLKDVFPEIPLRQVITPEVMSHKAHEYAEKVYAEHSARGYAPEAAFEKLEKSFLCQWARAYSTGLFELQAKFPSHMVLEKKNSSLGRLEYPWNLIVDISENKKCLLEVIYQLALVPRDWNAPGGSIGIIDIKKDGVVSDNPDAWLTGVCAWVYEYETKNPCEVVLIQLNREECSCSYSVMSNSHDSARPKKWLAYLLKLMLLDKCSDNLPFVIVKALTKGNPKIQQTKEERWNAITHKNLSEALEKEHGEYTCYLESFNLTDATIPNTSDEELRKTSFFRYGPMIERWFHE